MSGVTKTTEAVKDDLFKMEVKEALRLERVVEMYQW
jgi:hypothetical protein